MGIQSVLSGDLRSLWTLTLSLLTLLDAPLLTQRIARLTVYPKLQPAFLRFMRTTLAPNLHAHCKRHPAVADRPHQHQDAL